MRFARWVFGCAGAIGILMVAPGYFLEEQYGHDHPPSVNHPEFYYSFVGVTLAWQVLFVLIATDPVRYRLAMIAAMLEKLGFVVAIPILYALGRVDVTMVGFASMDAVWLILFIAAFLRTPK